MREREVVRGGGGSSIERFRQIRRRVDKTERNRGREMEKVDVRPGEKVGGWVGGWGGGLGSTENE